MLAEFLVFMTGTGILAGILGQYIGWGLFLIIFGTLCLLIIHDYALYSFGAFVTLVFYMALFWGVNLIPLALAHPYWSVLFIVVSVLAGPWFSNFKLGRLADGVIEKYNEELKKFLAYTVSVVGKKDWQRYDYIAANTSEEVRLRILQEAKSGKVSDELVAKWKEHCASHPFRRVDLSVKVTPDKFKARLFLWFFFWWISAPLFFLHHCVVRFFPNLARFLRYAWDWIFERMRGIYTRTVDKRYEGVDPRLVRNEKDD
ncbi:hypothetical protein FJY93_03950 [Candidatus Kaiserbacteria bacterium]|nr:hypothetical protein [Candidatus Kaiserbacteria bacterium]